MGLKKLGQQFWIKMNLGHFLASSDFGFLLGQNHYNKMQSNSMKEALIMIVVMVILQSEFITASPIGNFDGPGCPCENFQITSQTGNFVGNCLSTDQNGMFWCYVMKGCVNCDGGDSGSFPQYCKNYSNCRLSSQVNWQGSSNNK